MDARDGYQNYDDFGGQRSSQSGRKARYQDDGFGNNRKSKTFYDEIMEHFMDIVYCLAGLLAFLLKVKEDSRKQK